MSNGTVSPAGGAKSADSVNIEDHRINFTVAQLVTIVAGIAAIIAAIGTGIFFIARLSFQVEDLKKTTDQQRDEIKGFEAKVDALNKLIDEKYVRLQDCCIAKTNKTTEGK